MGLTWFIGYHCKRGHHDKCPGKLTVINSNLDCVQCACECHSKPKQRQETLW